MDPIYRGRRVLREFARSKNLLLQEVILDDKPANNDETFIIYLVAVIMKY